MDAQLFHVYIIRCADGSYYVGQTDNVRTRLALHASGKGAAYTARRLPIELAYSESFAFRPDAMAREKQLKRWSRAKKEALINADLRNLHTLAKRRRR